MFCGVSKSIAKLQEFANNCDTELQNYKSDSLNISNEGQFDEYDLEIDS